ncbi:hypothetical protein H206_06262 [Candidatus Electrothrix aarhusensis]|uniref:Uncharacterized protein n=1 Tax=Candidatus Electrothrix aarhusensis TaxID=1859131 RepID=A0A3S3R9R7_9BACT|nr:hypothetical protein H206_06262 [Candidatus Electrothrix aarhusensis]
MQQFTALTQRQPSVQVFPDHQGIFKPLLNTLIFLPIGFNDTIRKLYIYD